MYDTLISVSAPSQGSAAVPLFNIMRQVPSLLSWVGGAISNDPAVNGAGFSAMLSEMGALGRAECKLPAGEIPLSSGAAFSGNNVRLCGAGPNQTILNFGPDTVDGLTDTGTGNRIEGVGAISAGCGSVFKFNGAESPTIKSVAVFGGTTALEVTGNSGAVIADDIRLNSFSTRGFWAHDGVQGVSVSNMQINAGSYTMGSVGCIVLERFSSALRMANIEALKGARSLVCDAIDTGDVTCPAYGTFTSVYLDDGAMGSLIKRSKLMEFVGCWFSGGRTGAGYPCLDIDDCQSVNVTSTRFMLGGSYGVQHGAGNRGIEYRGCTAADSGFTAGAGRGISFAAGSRQFSVIGGRMANGIYSGGRQSYGLVVPYCDDYRIIAPDLTGNLAGPIYEIGSPIARTVIL